MNKYQHQQITLIQKKQKSIILQLIRKFYKSGQLQTNIYLMKVFVAIVCIWTLISFGLTAGVAPEPYCLSKPLYKQFPLVMEQILSHDMANSFSGFNLDIEITSNNTFATMSKKIRQLDRRNSYFADIISHYIQKKDNTVGKESFLLYKDLTGSVHFTMGFINSKGSLPQFNTTMIVTTDKSIECFDAALFLDHGLAIVDCLRYNHIPAQTPFTNIFFYIDLTGHKVTKIVQNQVYVDFKTVTKRKMVKFTNPATHYPYLVRAYFAEGVGQNADNTYLQFMGAQDPYDLQYFGLIDRSFLFEPKLAINDLEIYNGDIFILCQYVGLYRLQVTKDHKLLIHGKLKRNGMQKFSIYSDDLQEQTIIALSNNHNIYQIDWKFSSLFEHQVLNKYTIPSDSVVKDIKINDLYVIVQSKANVTNNANQTYEVDYTWIFSKGSRTYMNAYKVIPHNSSKVDIDIDADENHIYSADEGGLALFKIDQARLNLHYINQSMVGKTEDVVVTATSIDPRTNKSVSCKETMTVIFSSKDSLKIYETGFQMPKLYSANYPGELHIPLDGRFMGPNITFSIQNLTGPSTPQNWIDKVNFTYVDIKNNTIRVQDITFFHTDVLQEYGLQEVIYYYQDTSNKTHIAECIHVWEDQTLNCQVSKTYQHTSRISSFTTAFITNTDGWSYYYIMVLEGSKNQVTIIDFIRHQILTQITYQGHQQAEIHHVAASNGFLYVLRKNIKTIDVYSLKKCQLNKMCKLEFKIDIYSLKVLGVQYFAPEHITTDFQHPEVLFIKCLGSMVILDVDNKQKLHLLADIQSAATKDKHFRVAVNKYRMVLTASPDIIEQYSLQNLYKKDTILLTKNYPLYGYRIQPGADIQFSDLQFMVYVNAYDPKFNVSVVLIYKSGFPASAVLYDVIYLDKLYSRPGFQIQVAGSYVDFLSIAAGDSFKCYRVFEFPQLSLKNTVTTFGFNIKGNNTESAVQSDPLNITVVNNPTKFRPTKEFNQTFQNLKLQATGNYSWDDRKWFDGHVVNYTYACQQCNNSKGDAKVKIRDHIDNINILQVGGNDFIETLQGGIGVHEDLFLFRHNGSIREIINLPDQKLLETCIKVAAFETGQFVVTACQQLGVGIQLYMTSLSSFKPITTGPFQTDAYHARTFQVVHDVVMIVDQNPYPDYRLLKGSVFLYRVSTNSDTFEQFNLLDEIDEDDLMAAHGWNQEEAYIANAYLTHSTLTDTFRLYLTQLTGGFFVLDFTRHAWQNQLHVISIKYVNMNQLLANHTLHMPSDATYQAITFIGNSFTQYSEMQNILIVTKGYHNFQVTIVYDKSDNIASAILHRVYYRYGFYDTYNQVKTISGYVAVGYTIPSIYATIPGYKKQYVVVYDTSDYQHQSEKGYSQRYMLGAFPMNHREPMVFAFNKTYDWHTNGSRIGLIVSQPSRHNMYSASLSKKILVQLKDGFKTQPVNITAYSDFSKYSFAFDIINMNTDKDQVLFIIVVSIAGLFIILFGGYLYSVIRKREKSRVPQERQSLLTENQSFIKDTIPRSDNPQYLPPQQNNQPQLMQRQDSGYSSGDDEQGQGNVRRDNQTHSDQQQTQTPQRVQNESNNQRIEEDQRGKENNVSEQNDDQQEEDNNVVPQTKQVEAPVPQVQNISNENQPRQNESA